MASLADRVRPEKSGYCKKDEFLFLTLSLKIEKTHSERSQGFELKRFIVKNINIFGDYLQLFQDGWKLEKREIRVKTLRFPNIPPTKIYREMFFKLVFLITRSPIVLA